MACFLPLISPSLLHPQLTTNPFQLSSWHFIHICECWGWGGVGVDSEKYRVPGLHFRHHNLKPWPSVCITLVESKIPSFSASYRPIYPTITTYLPKANGQTVHQTDPRRVTAYITTKELTYVRCTRHGPSVQSTSLTTTIGFALHCLPNLLAPLTTRAHEYPKKL